MTEQADFFSFDAMKEAMGGKDPFANANETKYAKDERFYTLQKDKDGNGAALIRFVPDSERAMIQRMFKINTTVVKNGKKRFISQFSPTTIGGPCPFQEAWQDLWNSGDKDGAKLFSRGTRFVTNIKVLKDPMNSENNGKIFLYEMSGAMKDKIQNAVDPSEQDRELGAEPKELFNPLRGNSFRLVAKKAANGQITYDSSEVINEVTSIYDSVDDAIADIKENSHKLSDLLKPETFMSYDDLVKKKSWVMFEEQQSTDLKTDVAQNSQAPVEVRPVEVQTSQTSQTSQTPQATEQVAPKPTDNLDDLLSGLL